MYITFQKFNNMIIKELFSTLLKITPINQSAPNTLEIEIV